MNNSCLWWVIIKSIKVWIYWCKGVLSDLINQIYLTSFNVLGGGGHMWVRMEYKMFPVTPHFPCFSTIFYALTPGNFLSTLLIFVCCKLSLPCRLYLFAYPSGSVLIAFWVQPLVILFFFFFFLIRVGVFFVVVFLGVFLSIMFGWQGGGDAFLCVCVFGCQIFNHFLVSQHISLLIMDA